MDMMEGTTVLYMSSFKRCYQREKGKVANLTHRKELGSSFKCSLPWGNSVTLDRKI